MQHRNITDDNTRTMIYSLNKHRLSEAALFLAKFRSSQAYASLITTDLAELSDEDIVCLTLTRKAEDTNKIDIKILRNAILNVFLTVANDLAKEDINLRQILENDFDFFCSVIENRAALENHHITLTALEAAVDILKLMNYSRDILFTKNKYFNNFRYKQNEDFRGYLNLSGLDLKNANFELSNLSDVDFTDTNLSHSNLENANLDRTLLLRTDLSHAKLSCASMLGSQFGLAKLDNIQVNPWHITLLTQEFDKTSLCNQLDHLYQQNLNQVKHESIFKSITENINHSLTIMKVNFEEKLKLIDAAINHVLFGDQKANTVTNWLNYGVRLFSFRKNREIPTISLSKAQTDLIFIRNLLEFQSKSDSKNQDDFMKLFNSNRDNEFVFPEQKEKIQSINPTQIFINKYGSCYQILDVDQFANKTEIEKQYKKLSLKYHPDKNKSPEASEAFQKISNAKEILIDESTRGIHDQLIGITYTASLRR